MALSIKTSNNMWKLLSGLVCTYKNAGETANRVRHNLLFKLTNEINKVEYEIDAKDRELNGKPNLKYHPLIIGPNCSIDDFKCLWSSKLGRNSSGVLVLGMNEGTKSIWNLHNCNPLRTYHIKLKLGTATNNMFKTGKIVQKSGYQYVTKDRIDQTLANIQSAYQRIMYETSGIDPTSQAAYELAVKGAIRPIDQNVTIIYGIKCLEFNSPDFKIEIQCINEYENYLLRLCHEIGLKLNSLAHCTSIHCIRYSIFNLNNCLLLKDCNLNNVINNMNVNRKLINKHKNVTANLNKINSNAVVVRE